MNVNARPQRLLHCPRCKRDKAVCNHNPCTLSPLPLGIPSHGPPNSKTHSTYPLRTPAVTRIPKTTTHVTQTLAPTPLTSRLLAEKVKPEKLRNSATAWGIISPKKEAEPPPYDIQSTLSKLIGLKEIINDTTGEPQIKLIHFLNSTYQLVGKSHSVTVTGYDHYGMLVEMILEQGIQKWRLHDLYILWFDFPWEVSSWPIETRLTLSESRLPVGSSFRVRISEINRTHIRLCPSKYACPELNISSSFFPLASTTKNPYRYLLAVDLEATCDYCPHPKVTTKTAEIIEFPWVVIDTHTLRIVDEQQIYVRPDYLDGVTKYATKLTGISKDMVNKQSNLQDAIKQFDDYVKRKFGSSKVFRIVTDGIWDLQVQLHMEADKKNIPKAWYFKQYLDLKDEFRKFLPWFPESYRPDLKAMLKALNLEFVGKPHQGIDDSRNIANIVLRLLLLGHVFNNPKSIPPDYDPYKDPKFVDFGSVTEPDAWQCPNLACGVWNRPWLEKCKFCYSLKNSRLQPNQVPQRKM